MYNPGEMYSAVKSRIDSATNFVVDHKSALARTMAAGLVAVVAGCATEPPKPDFYPQKGWQNTMTYKDPSGKEVIVYDLGGIWNARNYHSNTRFNIEQNGEDIQVFTIDGTKYQGPGTMLIRGKIKGNLIDGKYNGVPDGWIDDIRGKVDKEGKKIETLIYWSGGVSSLDMERKK